MRLFGGYCWDHSMKEGIFVDTMENMCSYTSHTTNITTYDDYGIPWAKKLR